MKTSTLLAFAACAAEAFALNDAQRDHVAKVKSRRQILGLMTTMMGKGGKTSAPFGSTDRVTLTPNPAVPGARRVKMKYGPYNIIGMEKTSILGEGGALWNYPDTSVSKPETRDFTIFGMVAGLETLDGADANIDNGLWLHHMVQFNIGSGHADATCSGAMSLPHVDVGTTPGYGERFFSSGNERSYADMTRAGTVSAGYHVAADDYWALIVDLMNMNMEDKTVYMTITYDYVPGFPAGWGNIKPVWFDVNQCGTSEVSALSNTGAFTVESRAWTPNFEGEILGMGAHVHDGGIDLQVLNNPNHVVCDSKATYGGSSQYILPQRLRMGPEKWAIKHISHMGMCYGPELKQNGNGYLKKDQSWTVRANYNYDLAPGNANAFGNQEEIMAISIMYVKVPRDGVTLDNWIASAANPSMGATFSSIMSNIGENLGLASLFGSGSSSSPAASTSSSPSSSSMTSMNMKLVRRAIDYFQK